MKVVKNSDGEWMLDAGVHMVAMSCHHKKNGACGGCYARTVRALQNIAKAGDKTAIAVMDALKAEGAERKKSR